MRNRLYLKNPASTPADVDVGFYVGDCECARQLSCGGTCESQRVEEYAVNGQDSKHVSCYVEAQLGKEFRVVLHDMDISVLAHLHVDGKPQASQC